MCVCNYLFSEISNNAYTALKTVKKTQTIVNFILSVHPMKYRKVCYQTDVKSAGFRTQFETSRMFSHTDEL